MVDLDYLRQLRKYLPQGSNFGFLVRIRSRLSGVRVGSDQSFVPHVNPELLSAPTAITPLMLAGTDTSADSIYISA